VALDITNALKYLHEHGILHRDLKPSNVLVSNEHYAQCKDQTVIENHWSNKPILAKITDFGEARSAITKTLTALSTNTSRVDRGTKVFQAPEIVLKSHNNTYDTVDLKRMDMWSFRLIFYQIINPSVTCPFSIELSETEHQHIDEIQYNNYCEDKLPRCDPSYSKYQATVWKSFQNIYEKCCKFEPSDRISINDVHKLICQSQSSGEIIFGNG
jgi:serine/threonine protein kinase